MPIKTKLITGPWTCEHRTDESIIWKFNDHPPHDICSGNLIVAEIKGNSEYCRGNAQLIAKAPELYELLQTAYAQATNGKATMSFDDWLRDCTRVFEEIINQPKESRGRGNADHEDTNRDHVSAR